MSLQEDGFSVLLPDAQQWRESNIMKIPNTNLLADLGNSEKMGGRLWRLPPFSANTWHKHVDSWEFYFLLAGIGRMRVGDHTINVPLHGCVLVAPWMLRQIFNDAPDDALWLIMAAPQETQTGSDTAASRFYPEDPKTLPPELAGKSWPPR